MLWVGWQLMHGLVLMQRQINKHLPDLRKCDNHKFACLQSFSEINARNMRCSFVQTDNEDLKFIFHIITRFLRLWTLKDKSTSSFTIYYYYYIFIDIKTQVGQITHTEHTPWQLAFLILFTDNKHDPSYFRINNRDN